MLNYHLWGIIYRDDSPKLYAIIVELVFFIPKKLNPPNLNSEVVDD